MNSAQKSGIAFIVGFFLAAFYAVAQPVVVGAQVSGVSISPTAIQTGVIDAGVARIGYLDAGVTQFTQPTGVECGVAIESAGNEPQYLCFNRLAGNSASGTYVSFNPASNATTFSTAAGLTITGGTTTVSGIAIGATGVASNAGGYTQAGNTIAITGAVGTLYFNNAAATTGTITSNISAANAGATAATAMLKLQPQNALDATDWLVSYTDNAGTGNLFSTEYTGKHFSPASDQSADCDNAGTANTPTGKVCIQAGQGSMTLTNSTVVATSLVKVWLESDDATCVSVFSAAPGAGSVVIGCAGAATATANTIVQFEVMN